MLLILGIQAAEASGVGLSRKLLQGWAGLYHPAKQYLKKYFIANFQGKDIYKDTVGSIRKFRPVH
jgi:hypothetical protein